MKGYKLERIVLSAIIYNCNYSLTFEDFSVMLFKLLADDSVVTTRIFSVLT